MRILVMIIVSLLLLLAIQTCFLLFAKARIKNMRKSKDGEQKVISFLKPDKNYDYLCPNCFRALNHDIGLSRCMACKQKITWN